MSKGKAWSIGRGVKAALRRLEYAQSKAALRDLIAWAAPKPSPKHDRLTVAERIRFKYWLFWKYGPECAYCQRPYDWRHALTIDHRQPVSKDGAVRDIRNMALACRECNQRKGNAWEE